MGEKDLLSSLGFSKNALSERLSELLLVAKWRHRGMPLGGGRFLQLMVGYILPIVFFAYIFTFYKAESIEQ